MNSIRTGYLSFYFLSGQLSDGPVGNTRFDYRAELGFIQDHEYPRYMRVIMLKAFKERV